ncbi:MAG: acylphosphatase [Candidatus Omnitrophica bacterium]|nr:acylphosphatase [Candidatus Omnitrophota bacterium]
MANKRVRANIEGHVQGVFFRSRAREKAESLGINGWIENRPDGRVEGVFEGEEELVDEMAGWCRKGPSTAEVNKVDLREEKYEGDLQGFEIR